VTSVASSGGGSRAGGGGAGNTSSWGRGAQLGTTVAQLWPPEGFLGATWLGYRALGVRLGTSEAPWLAASGVRMGAREARMGATEVWMGATEV
jgi:hypothetical protein